MSEIIAQPGTITEELDGLYDYIEDARAAHIAYLESLEVVWDDEPVDCSYCLNRTYCREDEDGDPICDECAEGLEGEQP